MVYTDMMNRQVEIKEYPGRIVSVVPSQTELLYDLGLNDEVIGITKFCVHPEAWFRTKKRIGGTKLLNIKEILALQPDVVIANKEENTKEQIEELARYVPVWVSDIQTIGDGLEMIEKVAAIVGAKEEGCKLSKNIADGFSGLVKDKKARRAAYFIWYQPWMSVGSDTFIHDVINKLGWENVFSDRKRYPEVSVDELKFSDPDLILLSSEPYPFKDKHVHEIRSILPNAEIKLVDGEMFSWYGSRMLHAIDYFKNFLHHEK